MQLKPEDKWIQLTKWDKFINTPTKGTMRNIVARRKENGADIFLSMINNRFYINLEKFNQWMEKQKK